MGDDIETGRSTSFKNWAAHVGEVKIKTDDPKQ